MAFVFGKIRPALVTAVKNLLNSDGSDSGIFSGYIAVRMLDTNDVFDWVKWTNPGMGGKNWGIVTLPIVDQDCVTIGFDLRNKPFVQRMMTYNQVLRAITEQTPTNNEQTDLRLQIKQGELLIRGSSQQSWYFKEDGSVVFRLNDSLDVGDPNNSAIVFGTDKSITVYGDNINVNGTKVVVKADEVDVNSGNVNLGNGLAEPLIRNTDIVESIDSMGIPIFSIQYLTASSTTKSS